MSNIALVIPDLRCGGIQRAVVTLAEGLARRGYRLTVFTFSDTRSDFFALPPGVARVGLGLKSPAPTPVMQLVAKTVFRLRTLRSAVLASAPDVVIAHAPQVNVPTLLALRHDSAPIIVAEHGDVPATNWRKSAWYRLRRPCYRWAFKVVSVSESVDRNVAWLPPERRTVIRNAVAVEAPQSSLDPLPDGDAAQAAAGDFIVSVGRLSYTKGFDILIAAFAAVAGRFPQWKLIIVGDGELRGELERQVCDLKLEGRIVFAGAVSNPAAFLRRAKFFAMASRYEGFPLAHAEALACGLPVVATDCPSRPTSSASPPAPGGVRELLRRRLDGVLAPCEDPVALGRALAGLMEDRLAREALAQCAPKVLSRFTPEKILDDWERLIAQAMDRAA